VGRTIATPPHPRRRGSPTRTTGSSVSENLPSMYSSMGSMYTFGMSSVSVADARMHLSDVIARSQEEAVFIERRGQRAAVVVSPEQYERMVEALEDAEDNAAFDEAMAEEGENIPWGQVKRDLGWE
jgi:antitoxin Phd